MCNPDEDGALPDNFVLMLNSENPVDEFDEDGEWEDCDEDEEIWGNGYDRNCNLKFKTEAREIKNLNFSIYRKFMQVYE